MSWFIFSEVMFSPCSSAPCSTRASRHAVARGRGRQLLHDALPVAEFENAWPSVGPTGHHVERMEAWGRSALNTALLRSPASRSRSRTMRCAPSTRTLIAWLAATFPRLPVPRFQAYEYIHA